MPRLGYDVFETGWGWIAVAASAQGIRCTTLPRDTPEEALDDMLGMLHGDLPEECPRMVQSFRRQAKGYFLGERIHWDVSLDLGDAPPFFRRAWEACRTIPRGETRSYGWLAAQAGRPGAARASGQAMARNRVPLVVPCHRVIGSDGGLHGFGGAGRGLKARLLRLEQSGVG